MPRGLDYLRADRQYHSSIVVSGESRWKGEADGITEVENNMTSIVESSSQETHDKLGPSLTNTHGLMRVMRKRRRGRRGNLYRIWWWRHMRESATIYLFDRSKEQKTKYSNSYRGTPQNLSSTWLKQRAFLSPISAILVRQFFHPRLRRSTVLVRPRVWR
jgi:hypothetical protein